MPADTAPPWPDRVWLHKSTSGQDDVWTDTPNGLDSPAYVREAAVTAPAWDGRPQMPEVDAFHWLLKRNAAWAEAWLWQADADGCGTEHSGAWSESDGDGQPDTMARWYSYLGPCLTPSEVATIRAEAFAAGWMAAREAAATRMQCNTAFEMYCALINRETNDAR